MRQLNKNTNEHIVPYQETRLKLAKNTAEITRATRSSNCGGTTPNRPTTDLLKKNNFFKTIVLTLALPFFFCLSANAQSTSFEKSDTLKSALLNPLQLKYSILNKSYCPTAQPKAYSYNDLAFFCKVEVQIEKAAKIPFKFRLGDVRYVDYLEKKIDFKP